MTTLSGMIAPNAGQPFKKPIRELAIALLDTDNGISGEAWFILMDLLTKEGDNNDIVYRVESSESQYYLPEDWVNTQST